MRFLRCFAGLGAVAMLAAPASARAETPPPDPIAGAPYVHIDTTEPSTILVRLPRSPWERSTLGPAYRNLGVPICRAPCNTTVDARRGELLLVSSPDPDVPRSPYFQLEPAGGGEFKLSVEAGSKDKRRSGITLTALGGAMMGAGLFVAVFFGIPWGEGSRSPNLGAIGGTATIGLGLASLIGGIVLIKSNKTTVEVIPRGVSLGGAARLEGLGLVF
jgi:hypothetical protein